MEKIQEHTRTASAAEREGNQPARNEPQQRDVKAFEEAMRQAQQQPARQPGVSERGSRLPDASSLFSMEDARSGAKREALDKAAGQHDLETGGIRNTAEDAGKLRGAEFLESLFRSAQTVQAGTPAAAEAQRTAAPQSTDDALQALVSRILVSSPDKGGAEVRLTLNDGVLRGTEIMLQRDLSGALTVRCTTTDPASFQTLVAQQHTLREALAAAEHEPVTVEMYEERTEAEQNDTNRRSRGLDEL